MHPDYFDSAGRPALSLSLSNRSLTDRQVFSLRVMDMYSVSFTQHILECGVIVLGVLGKPLLGEERRRGQELCVGLDVSLLEVVGVGLIICEGVGLVNRGHTPFWAECAGCLRTSGGSGRSATGGARGKG